MRNIPMDIYTVRFENYKQLQAEFRTLPQESKLGEYGKLKRFGKFTGVSERFLTHVNSKIRRLGDASCQKMEVAFRKPPGWMDETHKPELDSASQGKSAKQNPSTQVPSQPYMSEEDFLGRLRARLEGASPIEVDRILTYLIAVEERKKAQADVRNKDGAKQ
jgi:hypothetical protein